MTFRYLSIANSGWAPGERAAAAKAPVVTDPFEGVRQRLLDLTSNYEAPLAAEQEGEAYGIVRELLEHTRPEERRATAWRLAEVLPPPFLPVIAYIINDCASEVPR